MRFFAGFFVGLLVVAAAAAVLAASGTYNFAAVNPPGKVETRLATFALNKSVAKRAPAGKNPVAASPELLRQGLAHYKENCVVCPVSSTAAILRQGPSASRSGPLCRSTARGIASRCSCF